jgi:hypothetical protein
LFGATRDSAVRAVFQAQPYDMLSLTTYDKWKEIDINFDPREVVASEPSEIPSSAPAQAPPEDRAFYTEYLPTISGFTGDCEKPLLNTLVTWSSLEVCKSMYEANNFVEFACETRGLVQATHGSASFGAERYQMAVECCQQEGSLHRTTC